MTAIQDALAKLKTDQATVNADIAALDALINPAGTTIPAPITALNTTAGPNGVYPYITVAMQAIGPQAWFDANGTQLPDPQASTVTILPAADGYYDRDCGTMSPKFASLPAIADAWPRWEQELFGPVTVIGQQGSSPPVLSTLGGDAGATTAVYYSKGFFNLQDHNYTFRNLVFRDLIGLDGNRQLSGIRGEQYDTTNGTSVWLFEDCWFDHCDTGFLGGSPGQQLIFRRCRFTRCGKSTGDLAGYTHNAYIGSAGSETMPVILEDCLSTDSYIGHLFKCRTHLTIRGTVRLIGDGIANPSQPCTASYCLDMPCRGVLTIESGAHLVLAMAEKASNGILLHYSGEGVQIAKGQVNVAGKLTLIGNSTQSWTNASGTTYPIVGFRDDSLGVGAPLATLNVTGTVEVFNIPVGNEGFPTVTRLSAKPTLDLSSPCLTTSPST
jgi:hypothetical protein